MDKDRFDQLWLTVCGGDLESPRFIQQNPTELWELCLLFASINPKRGLEIGNFCGGTTLFWRELASIVSIDLTPPQKTSDSGRIIEGDFLGHLLTDVEFIIGDSHEPPTLESAEKFAPYDFLFIDGDHSPEGVQMDYDMYSPLIRRGGIIAFHDWKYCSGDEVMPVQQCIAGTGITPRLMVYTTGFGIAAIELP